MMVILELPLGIGLMGSSSTFQAKHKELTDVICYFPFADDSALNTGTKSKMQEIFELFSAACKKKTKVMYQPAPAVPKTKPTITVGDQKLAVVWWISPPALVSLYQGHSLSMKRSAAELHVQMWNLTEYMPVCGKEEVSDCTANASCAMQSSCLPCYMLVKRWTVYSCHTMNFFHMRCLRNLLHIKWQDSIPDKEVLQRADMVSIYAMLMRSQLRWAGHMGHV